MKIKKKKSYPVHDIVIPPMHPGELLQDLMEINDLKVAPTANILGVSRQHLHTVLRGDSPVSPPLAAKLGHYYGNGTRIWLDLQAEYDAWSVTKEMARE